jgi:hypothetical protein
MAEANGNNCLDVLQSYGDFLSNNPSFQSTTEASIPQPLSFYSKNCTGKMHPFAFNKDMGTSIDYHVDSGKTIQSLYIPAFWQAILIESVSGTIRNKMYCYNSFPTLITDLTKIPYDNTGFPIACDGSQAQPSTHLITDLTQLNFEFVKGYQSDGRKIDYSVLEWQRDMCTQKITTHVGSRELTSYTPGSEECDEIMQQYCVESPGNIKDDIECACLADELEIEKKFCQPGNTLKSCDDQSTFRQFIPVTCFGKTCATAGYRFNRMKNQRCNTTMCQQIVNLIGQNSSINFEAELYCGTKNVPKSPTVTMSPVESSSGDVEFWVWILLAVAAVVVIFTPLAFILFKKSKERDLEDSSLLNERVSENMNLFKSNYKKAMTDLG